MKILTFKIWRAIIELYLCTAIFDMLIQRTRQEGLHDGKKKKTVKTNQTKQKQTND